MNTIQQIDQLEQILDNISSFPSTFSDQSMDLNHAMLIYSLILSSKPEKIFEFGIGTGLISRLILKAIEYNSMGKLTCIENLQDWPEYNITSLKKNIELGINVIHSSEEDFVKNCNENECDFLVSDADHINSHLWIDKVCKFVKNNGFMVFHDVAYPAYPNLYKNIEYCQANKLPYFVFCKESKTGEKCSRGLLVTQNKKD